MAYPTLPSTWSPSSQCVASTAFYYVVERTYSPSGTLPGGVIFSLMYGIPTPTVYGTITGATPSGTCVPPSFTTDVPYVTSEGRCPSGYSIACATGSSQAGGVASAITCCPRYVQPSVSQYFLSNEAENWIIFLIRFRTIHQNDMELILS